MGGEARVEDTSLADVLDIHGTVLKVMLGSLRGRSLEGGIGFKEEVVATISKV